jgi:hypothetical protein
MKSLRLKTLSNGPARAWHVPTLAMACFRSGALLHRLQLLRGHQRRYSMLEGQQALPDPQTRDQNPVKPDGVLGISSGLHRQLHAPERSVPSCQLHRQLPTPPFSFHQQSAQWHSLCPARHSTCRPRRPAARPPRCAFISYDCSLLQLCIQRQLLA